MYIYFVILKLLILVWVRWKYSELSSVQVKAMLHLVMVPHQVVFHKVTRYYAVLIMPMELFLWRVALTLLQGCVDLWILSILYFLFVFCFNFFGYHFYKFSWILSLKNRYMQVWSACKSNTDELEQPIHELDVLSGHENDVNYVQFRLVCPYLYMIFFF